MGEDEFAPEMADFPYSSIHRFMLTSAIPYHFRWKISQLKQFLNDLVYLRDKHELPELEALIVIIKSEVTIISNKMCENIAQKAHQRNKIAE